MPWMNELNNTHQSLHTVSTFKTTASGNVALLVLASLIVFFFLSNSLNVNWNQIL